MNRSVKILAALALVFGLTILVHGPYLWGGKTYFHDSLISLTHIHLFMSALFRGELPLWDPYSNGGQPLWPVAEAHPAFDPIALAVWSGAYFLNRSGIEAYQWTAVIWLFLFAVGGTLCSRLIYRNAWVGMVVFTILYGGPIASALSSQSHGFLVPFRYFPFVILSLLAFEKRPTVGRAFLLGAVTAVSLAGYQSIYSLFFIVVFALLYWAAKFIHSPGLDPRKWKLYPLAIAVFVIGALPTIAAGWEMLSLVPVLRQFPDYGYFMKPGTLLSGFFWRGLSFLTPDAHWRLEGEHAIPYLGTLPSAVVLLGLLWAGSALFVSRSKGFRFEPGLRMTHLEKTWIGFALVALFVCGGGISELVRSKGTFLGLRNWGFVFPLIILGGCQVFTFTFRALRDARFSRPVLSLLWVGVAVGGWGVFQNGIALNDPTQMEGNIWFVALLMLGLGAVGYYLQPVAPVILPLVVFLLTVPDLARFGRRNAVGLSIPAKHDLFRVSTEPVAQPTPRSDTLPTQLAYPHIYHYPWLSQVPVAKLPLPTDLQYYAGVLPFTHTFRLPAYQALANSGLSPWQFAAALGVHQPVFSFVYGAVTIEELDDAVRFLKQTPAPVPIVVNRPGKFTVGEGEEAPAEYKVLSYRPAEVELSVRSPSDLLFVFSDSMAKYWKVFVDNREADLVRANVMAKGVYLSEGNHRVVFSYEPLFYEVSFWVRAAFFAIFALMGVFLLYRNRFYVLG